MGRERNRWRRAGVAVALSLAFHAALLGGLTVRRSQTPPPEVPPIEVALVRPPRAATPPERAAQPDVKRPLEQTLDPRERRVAPPSAALAPALAPRPGPPVSTAGPVPTVPSAPSAPPQPARPAPDLAAVGAALRSADCSVGATLSARERQRCLERAAGDRRREPPMPPTTAQRHAREELDDARYKANRRLGERVGDPLTAQCAGSGICHRQLPVSIPFGRPPPASPVIPPSTLRGDDDALRPRPRP